MNTARARGAGAAASNTAALAAGGIAPSVTVNAETWNGSAWTEVGNLNTARERMGAGGTSAAALVFGGEPGNVAHTEEWDGASWIETSNLNTGRSEFGGAGTTTAGLAFGGQTGSPNVRTAGTEEWNVPSTTIKTVSTD